MSTGAYGGWPPQAAGHGEGPAAWPAAAEELLAEILFTFQRMVRQGFRLDVLETMGRSPSSPDFALDVRECRTAREHVREILRAVARARDPRAVLGSLGEALRVHDPHDGALPWLELAVLALTAETGLPADALLRVIGLLRSLAPPPGPQRLLGHLPQDAPGRRLLAPGATLPEILRRLLDHRGAPDARPALSFLAALAADPELAPNHPQLGELQALLSTIEGPRPGPRVDAAGRLIVQIRLDPETPEHIERSRYHLRASYYRQPLDGGPIERLNDLVVTASLAKEDLITEGSARLAGWQELLFAMRRTNRGPVRIEFLLPAALLGHSAELWSPTPRGHRLGLLHPVVVRSLDRYANPWLQTDAWYERWEHLFAETMECEAVDRIGWPPLLPERAADLPGWLDGRPTVACLGLDTPYDDLDPRVREAVLEAMVLDGVPAMLWRRAPGEPTEVVEALRRHRPRSLAQLPEAVHRHRKVTRAEQQQDGMTLLWDDPNCVDHDQDAHFPGMV
ncbi:hypothetical protein [Kitasatospora sp. SUK 42]|uniref:VMAP-C domain-containing protein n=1 Tax=Kitasatospora sp. SUK 42 TaxID=1588882 RepID=UPI0018CA872F|nr:hypothetical protein [Kitasatospora sp. SUK 42]MBV2155033.1 hypothetical protein [Kitasatospora sp. SUK 42]